MFPSDIPSQPQSLRETKRLKKSPHADISIYEDRAALLTYKGEDSIGVVIESREIVAALRQLFELAWRSDSKQNDRHP